MIKMSEDEYQKKLWEFFAEQGGVKWLSGAAAQDWYIRKEREFRKINQASPARNKYWLSYPLSVRRIALNTG